MSLIVSQPTSVVIVGAGIAGLTAARLLQQAGAEVTLLEARQRVGGRAYTVDDGFESGQTADLGPEIVDIDYRAMMRLCAELGVELSEELRFGHDELSPRETALERFLEPGRLILGDRQATADEVAGIAREIQAALTSKPPAAYEIVEQWARRAALSPAAHGALRGISRMPNQLDLDRADGHFLWGEIGPMLVRRVVGGTQRFPEALAAGLDIRLGSPVRDLVQAGGMVSVTTEEGEAFRVHRAIVTVPPVLIPTIGFTPPLAANKLAACYACQPALGGKVVAQYREGDAVRAALSRACYTDGPINSLWVSNPYVTQGPAVVTGFMCGADRFNLRSEEDAAATLDRVVTVATGQPVTRLAGRVKDWTADPYTRVLGTTPGEAQRASLTAELAAPDRRVHFAGDSTDAALCGTMEAAVRSGYRVAAEVLRRPVRMSLAEVESELVRG